MDNDEIARALLQDATLAQATEELHERRASAEAAEIQRRREEERAIVAAAEARSAAAIQRHRRIDTNVLTLGVFSAVVFVIPWLIGHFVLRGRLFSDDPAVVAPEIRAVLPYFWAETVAGWGAVALITGVLLAIRPWRSRIPMAATGVVLLVAGFWLTGTGGSLFDSAEKESVAKLASNPFPFARDYLECGDPFALTVYPPNTSAQPEEVWAVHLAQRAGYQGDGCNRVIVYRGWLQMGYFDLPEGEEFDPSADARWAYSYANGDVIGNQSWIRNHDPAGVWLNARTTSGRTVSTNLVNAGNGGLAFR
ncbi:hypothetical protein [Prescottella agglutinans]|uniref:Uncharacterized protein n=1 Tax=Prescottella agglutinans TaxID=1644129 RepID=A0ABT6MLX8_9NOCA|nr:hypothetical protein [Prescottella agglutinans]MDH6285059.1 hypothetical protein [Prescottella agglutinans]